MTWDRNHTGIQKENSVRAMDSSEQKESRTEPRQAAILTRSLEDFASKYNLVLAEGKNDLLDFEDASQVFAGPCLTFEDDRFAY